MKHNRYIKWFASISVTGSIWLGIGVFATHLVLNGMVLYQLFRSVEAYIPDHLSILFSQVFPVLFISMTMGATIGELSTFAFGWLFIMIAVALLKGRRQHRALFGWLGIVHLPVVLYSILVLSVFLLIPEQMVHAGLTSLASIEQLPAEIMKMQESGWFKWIRYGRYVALLLVVLCATEVVHRICFLSRSKAIGILLVYVMINGLVQVSSA